MELGLQGKRALVTGASKGIGLAVARRLVAEGAIVVDGSRQSSAELDVLCEESGFVHCLSKCMRQHVDRYGNVDFFLPSDDVTLAAYVSFEDIEAVYFR